MSESNEEKTFVYIPPKLRENKNLKLIHGGYLEANEAKKFIEDRKNLISKGDLNKFEEKIEDKIKALILKNKNLTDEEFDEIKEVLMSKIFMINEKDQSEVVKYLGQRRFGILFSIIIVDLMNQIYLSNEDLFFVRNPKVISDFHLHTVKCDYIFEIDFFKYFLIPLENLRIYSNHIFLQTIKTRYKDLNYSVLNKFLEHSNSVIRNYDDLRQVVLFHRNKTLKDWPIKRRKLAYSYGSQKIKKIEELFENKISAMNKFIDEVNCYIENLQKNNKEVEANMKEKFNIKKLIGIISKNLLPKFINEGIDYFKRHE